MARLVRDHLFLGSIEDAAEVLEKGSGEITHVLSLLCSASISSFTDWRPELSISTQEIRKVFVGTTDSPYGLDDEGSQKKALHPEKLMYTLELAGPQLNIVRMAVPLRDIEDEDLLDYLDVCLDFIEKSRKEGAVLVHCFAGVSRSASMVIAYLMRSENKTVEDALESLKQCSPLVGPNDGFLGQLKMFEDMGFKVDRSSSMYKQFRLKALGDSYYRGDKIDCSLFGADPGISQESNIGAAPQKKTGKTLIDKTLIYRCKNCRRIVALQENVVGHNPGSGDTCFQWQKRRSKNPVYRSEDPECSSLFVEPLQWMTIVEEGATKGKLSCVHCDTRLGYFNWSGIQCSCGSWITPAYQIHKSRLDASYV